MRPVVELRYEDRYRLWQELVREADLNRGRIFLPTDTIIEPGQGLILDVHVESPVLHVRLRARVEARRPGSLRFSRGLYVRLEREEVDKLHQALGLIIHDEPGRARKRRRYPMRWPVRFRTPALRDLVFTDDISAEGMQVEMPERVRAGHILEFVVETPQGHELFLAGTVMWTSERHDRIGVNFLFPNDQSQELFRSLVELAGGFFREETDDLSAAKSVIVIADDDATVVEVARASLIGHARIVTASSGEEALAAVRAERPDLVLLDILMPRLDGPTVCKALREDVELCEVPVIFLSAMREEDLAQHAEESGASDYLRKPFTPTQLREMVFGYLERFTESA